MSSTFKVTAATVLALLYSAWAIAHLAQASTVVVASPDNAGYQSWVDQVKRVPTPDIGLEVTIGSTCGGLGCSGAGTGQIELMGFAPRSTFYHELGHEFDVWAMTEADRSAFIALVGRPWATWWDVGRYDEGYMAGEWFAEVYAICAGAKHVYPAWEYTTGSLLLAGWRVRQACGLMRWAAAH